MTIATLPEPQAAEYRCGTCGWEGYGSPAHASTECPITGCVGTLAIASLTWPTIQLPSSPTWPQKFPDNVRRLRETFVVPPTFLGSPSTNQHTLEAAAMPTPPWKPVALAEVIGKPAKEAAALTGIPARTLGPTEDSPTQACPHCGGLMHWTLLGNAYHCPTCPPDMPITYYRLKDDTLTIVTNPFED